MLIESRLLDRYRLNAEIGRGGMGIVYSAWDEQESRNVALKSLLIDHLPAKEKEETIARFQREAKTSLTLRHPQIVQVYDFICENDCYYLVMELLEGQTLKDLQKAQQLPKASVLYDLLIQICDGMHFAHQKGIVHRDIKPDNIFITQAGQVKLMDFGIARQNTSDHFLLSTQPGTMLGTLSYMSPEQLQDSAMVDARTDIFSLGVVMYELFTGQLPFEGDSMGQTVIKILTTPVRPPRELNEQISAELEEVILKALVKRRGQRYQTSHDLAQDLLRLKASQAAPEAKTGDPASQTAWARQTFMAHVSNHQDQTRPMMGSVQEQLQKEGLSLESTSAQTLNDRVHGLILECDAEGLNAWLTLDPTYASEVPTQAHIEELIAKANLSFGLRPEIASQAIQLGYLEKTLIAQGEPPVQGHSAWLEYLLEERRRGPAERSDGSVDFRELQLHRSVQAGTPLIRKHPAVPGEAGINIYNQSIPPQNVNDCKLLEGPGTALASDDSCLLIATRDGMPVKMASSCRVESVLELAEVGVSTGNIRFDGSIVINGGIQKGYSVEAGGDIIVHGTVEDVILRAGGNLYLHAPVYGGSQTFLQSKYQLQGHFIQQARIECGGDLLIQEALMHCNTRVVGKVMIGNDQGRGLLNGGELHGTYFIHAKVLGSASSTSTQLALGTHPHLEAHLSELESQQAVVRQQMQENIKNMIYLRTQGATQSERMQALEAERSRLMFASNTLTDEVQFLKDSLKQAESSKTCLIRVTDSIHPGVKVHLSGAMRIFDQPQPGPLTLRSTPLDARNREVSISFG